MKQDEVVKSQNLKRKIQHFVEKYVKEYPDRKKIPHFWRTPLIGYADAQHPYIQRLPEIVSKAHLQPSDFMEQPSVVISYFIPFTPELAQTNIGVKDHESSVEWADAYNMTNTMMGELNEALVVEIQTMGYRAVVPEGVHMLMDEIKSNWSQRHIAYAAGLGTFGLNNMLITTQGSCGRYSSMIADMPVIPDVIVEQERCLYKSQSVCKKCVKNCFSGALTEDGFDRRTCFEICMKNMGKFGADVCGKCTVDVPCAFQIPQRSSEF